MSATATAPLRRQRVGVRASLQRSRRWALITSYCLPDHVRDLLPDAAVLHDRDGLKSDAEIAHMATNPWFVYRRVTLDNFGSCSRRPTS